MRSVLFVDVEAVPDADTARRVAGHTGSDEEALAAVAPPRSDDETYGFPKPLYHRVVAISCGLADANGTMKALRSVGEAGDDEQTLLSAFWVAFTKMARQGVRIVTWNGRGYDLPVLVQRGLMHGINVSAYVGNPNYMHRYRDDHLDLMDWFSNYRASTPLSQNEMAAVLGVPGKLDVNGSEVAELYEAGDIETIRQYCTCDVATLALIYARLAPLAGWAGVDETQALEESTYRIMQQIPLWAERVPGERVSG